MALPFLGKKKAVAGKGFIPIDRIRDLASKGFSEPEIIDILRKEGHSPVEVDRGLAQALKVSVTSEAPVSYQSQPLPSNPPQPTPSQQQLPELPTLEQIQQQPQRQASQQLEIPETSLPQEYYSSYSTEEYIDYLVSQRVTELYDRFNELSDKNDELSKKLEEIKSKLAQLEGNKAVEQQASSTRVDELRGVVTDVNARIGGLEKAFKDTLPSLIESVKTLADLIQRFKREPQDA